MAPSTNKDTMGAFAGSHSQSYSLQPDLARGRHCRTLLSESLLGPPAARMGSQVLVAVCTAHPSLCLPLIWPSEALVEAAPPSHGHTW